MGPIFYLRTALFSLSHRILQGGKGRAVKAFFWRFFRGRLTVMEDLCSVPAGPVPALVPQGDPIRATVIWGDKGKFPLHLRMDIRRALSSGPL